MKLLDNYLDRYYTRKVASSIVEALSEFNIDIKTETCRDWFGYRINFLVKLREENDAQYAQVWRVYGYDALLQMTHIEKASKEVKKQARQVLAEKHKRLG